MNKKHEPQEALVEVEDWDWPELKQGQPKPDTT